MLALCAAATCKLKNPERKTIAKRRIMISPRVRHPNNFLILSTPLCRLAGTTVKPGPPNMSDSRGLPNETKLNETK
jgi:hypothetical protein